MVLAARFTLAAALIAVVTIGSSEAFAQNSDAKPATGQPAAGQPADPAKDAQRQVDELAEAARQVSGAAGNAECVWLGRRVVGLMWRDDMDTAFRHLDLYDRFGCPGPHIQAAFRCVVRQANNIDPKVPQTLNSRVHACWIAPSATQTAAGAAPAAAATSAAAPASATPGAPAAPAAPAPNAASAPASTGTTAR